MRLRLPNNMPNLDFFPYNGRIPTAEKLKRAVENGLKTHNAVIALTDVYTGTKDFKDANDAKDKMRQWVGNEREFYPHVALHDFEAWLIPYWSTIQKFTGHNKAKPSDNPEQLNHNKPPSHYVKEIYEAGFRRGTCPASYKKIKDGMKILKGQDLLISANACPELKAFLNTILRLSRGELIP